MNWELFDQVMLPFSAVFGAIVGSFLNAAIYRLPRNISMVTERRSFCPRCRATIAWYDNIPVLSYLFLLGRCRSCRKRISLRYPLIELLTAGLFAALYWHVRHLNGPGPGGGEALLHWSCLAVYMPLVAGLILVAFVDLQDYEETPEEKKAAAKRARKLKKQGKSAEAEEGPKTYGIIPDEVTVGGLALAVPLALIFPQTHWNMAELVRGWPRLNACFDVAIGAVVGGGMTFGMGVMGKVLFKKAAMGFGDVKLMAMLGALLGWKAAVLIFFLAPVFGAIFGIAMLAMSGEHYVRYGPFLAAAAVIIIFYEPLASVYFDAVFNPGPWALHHKVPFVSLDCFGFGP